MDVLVDVLIIVFNLVRWFWRFWFFCWSFFRLVCKFLIFLLLLILVWIFLIVFFVMCCIWLLGVWLVRFCEISIVLGVFIWLRVEVIEIWVRKNFFWAIVVSCFRIFVNFFGDWLMEIVFKVWMVVKCRGWGVLLVV